MTSERPALDTAQALDRMAAARADYTRGGLSEAEAPSDPIELFTCWYDDAVAAGLHEPNAMVVSTVSPSGVPSSRLVLLKGVRDGGFCFYTNLGSRKGRELAHNPVCALLFPWHSLERQVRVEGRAVELPREDVAAYFSTRPRGSRLGAWASRQSSEVVGREELDAALSEVDARFPGEVPVPDFWGGFMVRPEAIEFWQGRPGRMHDRLEYRRTTTSGGAPWRLRRLAP